MDLNKFYAASGMASAAVFMTLWITAAYIDSNWELGYNALSDLGTCGNHAAEIAFNMACAVAGLFGVMFGIYVLNRKGIMHYTGVFMILSSFGLTGIGVINESYGDPHAWVAMSYAFFGALSMVLSMISDYRAGRRKYAVATLVLLLIVVGMQTTQDFTLYEPVDVTCFCAWAALQSFKYLMLEIHGTRAQKPDKIDA